MLPYYHYYLFLFRLHPRTPLHTHTHTHTPHPHPTPHTPHSTPTPTPTPPPLPLPLPHSSGVSASEWNRGAVPTAERCNERALVFRCMFLEQTPVCCNSFQFADNPSVLKITVRHPDFYNTEILLRWNGDSIHDWNHIHLGWNRLTDSDIWQLLPRAIHFFIRDFIWKASAVSVLWVFPHRNDSWPHQEQHTIHNKLRRQHLEYCNGFFCCVKLKYFLITRRSPIRVVRKMSP